MPLSFLVFRVDSCNCDSYVFLHDLSRQTKLQRRQWETKYFKGVAIESVMAGRAILLSS